MRERALAIFVLLLFCAVSPAQNSLAGSPMLNVLPGPLGENVLPGSLEQCTMPGSSVQCTILDTMVQNAMPDSLGHGSTADTLTIAATAAEPVVGTETVARADTSSGVAPEVISLTARQGDTLAENDTFSVADTLALTGTLSATESVERPSRHIGDTLFTNPHGGIFGTIIDSAEYLRDDFRTTFRTDSGSIFRRTFRAIDRFLSYRQRRVSFDTTYLSRPLDRWSLRFSVNYKENQMYGIGMLDGEKVLASVHSRPELSQTFGVSYRDIGLSFTINPASFFGEKEDIGFGLSWYGQSMGIKLETNITKSFSGTVTIGEMLYDIPRGSVDQFKTELSGYYIFNSRKFSYPAIINQGYIQRRSAGGIILKADAKWAMLHSEGFSNLGNAPLDINYFIVSAGGGYGYNYVFPRGVMLHASGTASLVLLNSSRFKVETFNKGMTFGFPDFVCSGLVGVVYPFGKSYTGLFFSVTDDSIGDSGRLLIEDLNLWGQVFYGIRF
ncbi:MAG: DUF4421 family protein [Candidatus Cryptobacteroides sp.]